MRLILVAAILAVSAGFVGCSSGSGGSGATAAGGRNFISFEELQEHSAVNLMEAVRRLRPRWLGARTGAPAGQDFPVVMVNDARFGDMNSLLSIQVTDVEDVRYMRPRDATTRYGTGFMGGAIVVSMR